MGYGNNALIHPDLPIVREYDDKYDKSSIEEVLRAVSNKDPVALYELASRYRLGQDGVEKDSNKAFGYYKAVLEKQNNAGAFYYIGYFINDGLFGEDRKKESVPYYLAAMRLGSASAAIEMGIMYTYGDNVAVNLEKALECFYSAMKYGRGDAWYNIGCVYEIKGDYRKAVDCFEKALDYQIVKASAAVELGDIYALGIGSVDIDTDKAYLYYQAAYKAEVSDDSFPLAIFKLAEFLFYPENGHEDEQKAFELFQEDSNRGGIRSNVYLGYFYGNGIKGYLAPNIDLAFKYLNNVLDKDIPRALLYQGMIHYFNLHDADTAKIYLSNAVNAGSKEAKEVLKEIDRRSNAQGRQQSEFYTLMARGHKLYQEDIFEAVEVFEEAYRKYPEEHDSIVSYASCLGILILLDDEAEAFSNPQYYDNCKKLLEVSSKMTFDRDLMNKYRDQALDGIKKHENYTKQYTFLTFDNNMWSSYGVLSPLNCAIIDNRGKKSYICDSGRLIGMNGASISIIRQDGLVIDKIGKIIGKICDYQDYLKYSNNVFSPKSFGLLDQQVYARAALDGATDPKYMRYVNLISDKEYHLKEAGKYVRSIYSESDPVIMQLYVCQLLMETIVDAHVRGLDTDMPEFVQRLQTVVSVCYRLKNYPRIKEYAEMQSDTARFYIGWYYSSHKSIKLAETYLRAVNVTNHPWAACSLRLLYGEKITQQNKNSLDVLLKEAVLSCRWENNLQKGAAWFLLSIDYADKDPAYAYQCLRFAVELDPGDAIYKEELSRYKRDGKGRIFYSKY